jgi:vacuolar-type H+-ATPase subunit F/Vma7
MCFLELKCQKRIPIIVEIPEKGFREEEQREMNM